MTISRRKFLSGLAATSVSGSMLPRHGKAKPRPEDVYPAEVVSDFSRRLRPLGRILELEETYVWCNAPIDGDDGRVHVFFSRWPSRKGMGGWLTCCEIAHAVADAPEGPYTVTGTVLAPRGPGHWDATTCHNPHVQKVGDRYALFYLGNSNGRTNTKRIGLALATSLDGPWQRSDAPILEAGPTGAWDDHCTTNPSLLQHADGRFWLYYKSWNTADYERDRPPVRGNRQYGLAIADRLEGPYEKHPRNPLVDFSARGENRQCEDAYVWQEDDRFRMIVRDMGVFNHEVGLLMESTDGLAWSEPKIAYLPVLAYVEQPPAPPHLKRYDRFERPQLLLRDGRPAYLFVTSQGGQYATASGFVFRIAE